MYRSGGNWESILMLSALTIGECRPFSTNLFLVEGYCDSFGMKSGIKSYLHFVIGASHKVIV